MVRYVGRVTRCESRDGSRYIVEVGWRHALSWVIDLVGVIGVSCGEGVEPAVICQGGG